MILNPDEIVFKTGVTAAIRLHTMDTRITPDRIRFPLAGGIMTARNMPYKATFKALKIRGGRKSPETAPRSVPRVHPGTAAAIRP